MWLVLLPPLQLPICATITITITTTTTTTLPTMLTFLMALMAALCWLVSCSTRGWSSSSSIRNDSLQQQQQQQEEEEEEQPLSMEGTLLGALQTQEASMGRARLILHTG
ncbi:hypothetical protein E2C01_020121 [Portunus trituberculatus]|uniref:Uncharacterized protein n=1 Tax=Portunus trituberculatus TaxID=210409 RepID=A0A5B7E0N5_PORTR|nr:hypothetical protein [Portunus trituberculatus]